MLHKCENELGPTQPKFAHVWVEILFGISHSPCVEKQMAALLERCRRGGECEYGSIDSTAKPNLPLTGQVNRNKLRAIKRNQASPYADQYRAVIIVRWATGPPQLIAPTFSESAVATGVLYSDRFNLNQREAVKYMDLARKTRSLSVSTMRKVSPR